MEGNHLSPRNLTCCVRISNPFPLCSSYKMFRFNSSPRGCRSELTPLNGGNEGNRLFKRKLLQQTVRGSQKRRELSWLNSFVENCLFFSNGEHFLSGDTSKKGRLYAMHRPIKGCCISFCQRAQVLTKMPVFPMEKQMFCLPRPVIWAKYCPQGIYKANKTHSSLLAEKRYSNNRLPRRLPNPGLIRKRVKSKHSTNTRPSAVARFHHNLGKVDASSHSVIDFSGPLYRFAVNVTQSPREKDHEHTEQMSKSHSQSHFISSRNCKPHRVSRSGPPYLLAGPSTLQRITNTAHKIPRRLSRQLQDTHVPKQRCSH